MSIPLALFMGLYMYRFRKGRIAEATVIGVVGMVLAVVLGKPVAASSIGHWFLLSREQLILAMAAYGFIASVLPVWLLLCPRDYLSSYMKIGTIAFLVVAVVVREPAAADAGLQRSSSRGGGPIIPGPLFPFAFITIACGAISGFHALISSGTTPKMIDRESDIRPIGYGAMLMEGLVGIMALLAAAAMFPGDYFAINTSPAVFASLGIPIGQPAGPRSGRRRDRRRPPRRRGVARGRHRADLQRPARHARADGLLVPLRDHVRGAVHPDHDRHRHARRPVPGAGVPRAGSTRRSGARSGCRARSCRRCIVVVRVGLLHLDRQHQHDLADVRHRQPAAGLGRAGGRHDDHHQHREGALRVGHRRAAGLRVGHDADRRRAERARQFLADGDRRRSIAALPGANSTRR